MPFFNSYFFSLHLFSSSVFVVNLCFRVRKRRLTTSLLFFFLLSHGNEREVKETGFLSRIYRIVIYKYIQEFGFSVESILPTPRSLFILSSFSPPSKFGCNRNPLYCIEVLILGNLRFFISFFFFLLMKNLDFIKLKCTQTHSIQKDRREEWKLFHE